MFDRCSVNKTYMESDEMNVQNISPAMVWIYGVIRGIKSVVKNYEIAHNKGIYDNADK